MNPEFAHMDQPRRALHFPVMQLSGHVNTNPDAISDLASTIHNGMAMTVMDK